MKSTASARRVVAGELAAAFRQLRLLIWQFHLFYLVA
jgi:hypothetical protein